MKKRLPLVLPLVLSLGLGGSAAGAAEDLSSRLGEQIPKLMQAGDIPGLSIAVIQNGRISWSAAFGVRDVSSGASVQKDTIFPAASLSKPVVAYLTLRLADRGTLNLDTPLVNYLPYDRLQHDERARRITARMVLSQSTGLPNWGAEKLSLDFTPGERFGYSGEGFVFLQKVLEKLTGRSLQDLAHEEVFAPLGMRRTSFIWQDSFAGGGGAVVGVNKLGQPQVIPREPQANAASSLLTTAEDYGRFLIAVLKGQGLKKETAAAMLAPQVRIAGRIFDAKSPVGSGEVAWGLGWGLERSGPAKPFWIWHWGDNGGFRAWTTASPGQRTGVVYLTNSVEGLSIAEAVSRLTVGIGQPALGRLEYERYDSPRRLARKDLERAFANLGGAAGLQRYREFQAKSPDLIDAKLSDSLVDFLSGTGKSAEAYTVVKLYADWHPRSPEAQGSLGDAALETGDYGLALTSFEKSVSLNPEGPKKKREILWAREGLAAQRNPVSSPAETLRRFAGSYGPRKITLEDSSLYYQRAGRPAKYKLLPLAADTFLVDGLGSFRVRFMSDGDGHVTKLVRLHVDGVEDESPRDP
jgi:CubicO group peptidase (beta-lactamase class C family)